MYKVWNEKKCEEMEVDEEWMDGVKTKGASEFIFNGTDKLLVIYNKDSTYEKKVSYDLVYGNWGFPTTLA